MDDEMIERVSKAILETPNASDYKRLVAVNAIKAMREPTNNMIITVIESKGQQGYSDVYKIMIDAIIND